MNITQQSGPTRRRMRLEGYDYSTPGAYFVTACTQDRRPLFGRVIDGRMAANPLGTVVEDCWDELPDHYDSLALDAFILMPNHVHGVILLQDEPNNASVGAGLQPAIPRNDAARRHGMHEIVRTSVGAGLQPAIPRPAASRRHGLPEIVRAFKTFSARKINRMRASTGASVWQRGFYDHVIRDEDELDRVRTYILDNPRKWSEDPDNPENWPSRRRV